QLLGARFRERGREPFMPPRRVVSNVDLGCLRGQRDVGLLQSRSEASDEIRAGVSQPVTGNRQLRVPNLERRAGLGRQPTTELLEQRIAMLEHTVVVAPNAIVADMQRDECVVEKPATLGGAAF